jgi:hypothetical protein
MAVVCALQTRLVKPPTSVLLFPLKTAGQEAYGVLYCMSSMQSMFTEVSPKLQEVCKVCFFTYIGTTPSPGERKNKLEEKTGLPKAMVQRAACAH